MKIAIFFLLSSCACFFSITPMQNKTEKKAPKLLKLCLESIHAHNLNKGHLACLALQNVITEFVYRKEITDQECSEYARSCITPDTEADFIRKTHVSLRRTVQGKILLFEGIPHMPEATQREIMLR